MAFPKIPEPMLNFNVSGIGHAEAVLRFDPARISGPYSPFQLSMYFKEMPVTIYRVEYDFGYATCNPDPDRDAWLIPYVEFRSGSKTASQAACKYIAKRIDEVLLPSQEVIDKYGSAAVQIAYLNEVDGSLSRASRDLEAAVEASGRWIDYVEWGLSI